MKNNTLLTTISLLTALILSGCAALASLQAPTPTATPSPVATVRPTTTPAATPSPSPTATLPPTPTATLVATYPTRPPIPTPAPSGNIFNLLRAKRQSGIPSPDASACDITNVVIISIDGLRPDALEQADTPSLDLLRAHGAYTSTARAVTPSVTLINHASMLGGVRPEKHGIYWNIDNAELGKIEGPTLFSLAHAAGFTTAMVVGKPKLEDLVLPNSVDQFIYAGYTDFQVVDQAVTLLQSGLPDIFFIHLPDVDSAGHATGWMSLGQLLVINQTDGLIGQIIAALQDGSHFSHTLLILTSDHGGSGTAHGSDSVEHTTIPWLAVGPGVPAGTIIQTEIVIYDTAATALHALHIPQPDNWDGQPVLEIFNQNDCRP